MATEGDLCPSCLENHNINVMKYLYINLNEAVLKCESSSCLYPFKNFRIKSINEHDLDTSIPLESKLDDTFLDFLDNKNHNNETSLDIKKYSPKREKHIIEEDSCNSYTSTSSTISSSSSSNISHILNPPSTESSLKITRCLKNLKLKPVKTENLSQTPKVKPHVRQKVSYNNMKMTPLNFLKNLGTLK